MPPPNYRRRIRDRKTTSRFIRIKFNLSSPLLLNTITYNTPVTQTGANNREIIQQYFYDIIDAVIQQTELNTIIEKANTIISIFSKKEDVYAVIDLIENNALSIVKNITEGMPLNIIECRIEYLRKLLADIPDEYQDYGEIGCLINEIINSITEGVEFSVVIQNIETIQDVMSENISLMNAIDAIEENLFSIIRNITVGTPFNIIESRIEYLQKLISDLPCA
jgi:hypothetical protein